MDTIPKKPFDLNPQAFPLDPFLTSLEADGIRLTVQDFERINRLLEREGDWSLAQFRDALAALLVKDEEQQVRFLCRFEEFLQAPAGAESKFDDVNLDAALNDLKRLSEAPTEATSKPSASIIPKINTPSVQSVWKRIPWLGIFAVLLILGMLISLGFVFFRPPPLQLHLTHEEVQFGGYPMGSRIVRSLNVTNTGREPVQLAVTLTGDHKDIFEWECELDPPLLPQETRLVRIRYLPSEIAEHHAEIIFRAVGRNYEKRVPLSGVGQPLQSEPELPDIEPALPAPQPQRNPRWRTFAGWGGFFLFGWFLYLLHLYRTHRVPKDKPAKWDENGPRHFPLGSIGGEISPWLNAETLDLLADTMGYFQTRRTGRRLNIAASIRATLRQGGLPYLIFHRHREVRSLLILEDNFAEAIEWNPVARELADGMRRRGIPLIYGGFQGTPDRFIADDGTVYYLEDLEDERRGYLLLIFTDGKGFYRSESSFVLETIARWPMVAWMELRDPIFWDETTALPAHYNVPIYPATSTGVIQALQRFLAEQGTMADYGYEATHNQPAPVLVDSNLTVHLQVMLGDAYLWAADCAMMQPITPALADAVRCMFHPHLPPVRIERLFAIPDTRHNISGLQFTDDVLKVLRYSFLARRSEAEQVSILEFLHEHIKLAEPDTPMDSLAYLKWEMVSERLLFELDPNRDLQRMGELAKSPLENKIIHSFENYGFSGETDKVPLRVKPKNKNALQRLARISDQFKTHRLSYYPVSRFQLVSLTGIFLVALIFAFSSIRTYANILPNVTETPNPPVANISPIIFIDYVVQANDTLFSIAESRFDTSIALMAEYGISQDEIVPGATINLPIGNPEYCPGRNPYVVGEADTAFSIGQRFNMTAEQLGTINSLDESFTIHVAEILCVADESGGINVEAVDETRTVVAQALETGTAVQGTMISARVTQIAQALETAVQETIISARTTQVVLTADAQFFGTAVQGTISSFRATQVVLTADAQSTETAITPTPALNNPTSTISPVKSPTSSTLISQPVIVKLEILPGNALRIEWEWDGTLSIDEKYAVYLWRTDSSGPSNAVTWVEELFYQTNISNSIYPTGQYFVSVAVVRGPPDGNHLVIVQSDTLLVAIP